jgi:hypothetical protein
MPTIVETSDNVPIFRLLVPENGKNNNWKIEGFTLSYQHDQPPSNRNSVAIALGAKGSTGSGIYDFVIERVVFTNSWRGIAVDYDSYTGHGYSCPIWGWTIENITSYRRMSGATIWFDTLGGGSPRGSLLNFYAQNENAVEPALTIKGMSELYARNLEFNFGTDTNFYLQNRENILDAIRFEQVTTSKDDAVLGTLATGQTIVTNMEVQSFSTRAQHRAYFLRSYGAQLTLENLWTYGAKGGATGVWRVAQVQHGGSFKFRGTWLHHDDGKILWR